MKKIKEFFIIVYEITIKFLPLTVLFLLLNNKISFKMDCILFLYALPWMLHAGIFGEKSQKYIDKLLDW